MSVDLSEAVQRGGHGGGVAEAGPARVAGAPRVADDRERVPRGGFEAFFGLATEDNVLNVVEPLTRQVEAEFPAAPAGPRSRLSIEDGPIGLVGGSQVGGVAPRMLTNAELPVAAAALVNPVTQAAPVIAANELRKAGHAG
ncbi:hypothetical protein [Amycolatopsis sp. NPDC051071]|uniref:hypothetical protein n=1 Tax=Amycolatopsis sp. NPDC051071 TaxID=3154637 RepID=UPI00342A3C82